MRTLNAVLHVLTGAAFALFLVRAIANYRDYRAFPEVYEVRSAPWYCYGALTGFLIFIAVAAVCAVVRLWIGRKM